MVGKRILILLAGTVWFCAGLNILRIGVKAYLDVGMKLWLIVLTAVIFCLFGQGFIKMTMKNTKRIRAFEEEKRQWWHFFNLRSYLIMAFFMTFGISLRISGVAPDYFFAFFYTGLGSALTLAGVIYFTNSWRCERENLYERENQDSI